MAAIADDMHATMRCKMPADEPYSGISVAISHAKVVLIGLLMCA